MGELNSGLTLYDINKNMLANKKSLTKDEIKKNLTFIKDYLDEDKGQYYLLLNKELSDFTIFKRVKYSPEAMEDVVIECMQNRGALIDIYTDDNGALALWIRQGKFPTELEVDKHSENIYCYYLMNWDDCLVEVH